MIQLIKSDSPKELLVKVLKASTAGIVLISTLSSIPARALPIDWTGVFGVDTHLLNNIRRNNDPLAKYDNPASPSVRNQPGTQAISSGENGAHFQTYVFKLFPQVIVNDAVTFKAELSTGFIRGGFMGGDSSNTQTGSTGNNAYYFTTPNQRSGININQAYMELYADTALVRLGRMSKHYGLGAMVNGGTKAWDRFITVYDGVEAEMKIGNFSLIPHWALLSSQGDDTGEATRSADVRELGLVAKYDNRNRDLMVSVLYAKRYSEFGNTLYFSNTGGTAAGVVPRGRTQVTIIDPYISKKWDRFTVSAEAPMLAGDFGTVYDSGSTNRIAARAYLLEARYEHNPKWDFGLLGGQVSGADGRGAFGATYLNPNYQVANLMFRYHWPSFNENTGRSIFENSITNARYANLFANYKADKWTWKTSFTMAKAMETAKANQRAYHHEENYSFQSGFNQSDDMGYEVDLGFDYRWNPNVLVSGYYGFWFVGDYYAFTNTGTNLGLENVHGGGVNVTLEF